jgi:hypothetical protein
MVLSDTLKRFAAFALFVAVVAGCGSLKNDPITLRGPDGKFQITVPGDWSKSTDLHSKAEIQAANRLQEMYAIVLTEAKDDLDKGMTLGKFTDITKTSLTSKYTSPEATETQSVSVNGNDGMQYELQGTKENTKLRMLVTTVETPAHYHQILTWTLPSKWDDNKSTLKQVAESFRPAPSDGAGAAKSSASP